MRVDNALVSQSLIDSTKTFEKKAVSSNGSPIEQSVENGSSYIPLPFGTSGTYSPSSLKAAVEYHAKFLSVAQNNVQAANHTSAIPDAILQRFSGA
jgi:hypothetical protein